MNRQKMTPSEALVETLLAEGVQHVFGIVGSAFMDTLDLFPDAGIRFVPVAHRQAAAHAGRGHVGSLIPKLGPVLARLEPLC